MDDPWKAVCASTSLPEDGYCVGNFSAKVLHAQLLNLALSTGAFTALLPMVVLNENPK